MTLAQAYAVKQGTAVPSASGDPTLAGQCVSWANYVLLYVYNHPYLFANAINWFNNPALLGKFEFIPYAPGVYPLTGDFVVWNIGQYGHIDLCASNGGPAGFTGYDSNWDRPVLDTIQHNYSQVVGYIRYTGGTIMAGVTILGAPAAAGQAGGRIDVFVRGSDNNLYQKYLGASGWSNWVKVGSGVASDPTVSAPYGDNRIDVFFTGGAGDLVHTYFNGTTWTPNESLGVPVNG